MEHNHKTTGPVDEYQPINEIKWDRGCQTCRAAYTKRVRNAKGWS